MVHRILTRAFLLAAATVLLAWGVLSALEAAAPVALQVRDGLDRVSDALEGR